MSESKVLPMAKTKNPATVSYGQFQEATFMRTMAKLTNQPFKNPKTAYSVMKITKAMDTEMNQAQELFIKTLKEYAKLDDKGEIKPMVKDGQEQPGTYEIQEGKIEDWKKAFTEFKAIEADLGWNKIKLNDLEGMSLSANDLDHLETIVETDLEQEAQAIH